jgi:hypothetical protein
MKSYAVVGSRSLWSSGVKLVCNEIISRGAEIVVGCASGVDAAVLSAALSGGFVDSVRCFAAFDFDGAGACNVSAVDAVKKFEAAGGKITWLAGGGLNVPIRARLATRASAVINAANAGCIGFIDSPNSIGTARALTLAAKRGLEVKAYPCGFDGEDLPVIGDGRWRQSDDTWVWLPNASLF